MPVAGVAQLALVWWGCARAGMPVLPRWPRLTPEMRRLTVIMVPALLAGGVVQINLIVGRQVGSFFDGAVAWLSYADRLYQLPLGVVGIAIGVVLLPDLSRRLKAGDGSGGRDAINRATEFTLALTLPAAVALMVIPVPIVAVLFQRGAFTAADTWPTALAVAVYGAGLPAFVMQKVISPLYYAREDTRSPFRFAVHAMVVNAAIALGLAPFIGFIAAALGTTVAGWVMLWPALARHPAHGRRRRRPTPACAGRRRASPLACAGHGRGALPRRARCSPAPLADPPAPLPRARRSSWRSAWRPTPPPSSPPAACAPPTSAPPCAGGRPPARAGTGSGASSLLSRRPPCAAAGRLTRRATAAICPPVPSAGRSIPWPRPSTAPASFPASSRRAT